MRPFTSGQTDDYIHTRLSRAGLVGDSPFSPQVVRSIYKASSGRPGLIHQLAGQVLSNQPAGGFGRAWSAGSLMHERWARLGLSGAVLALAAVWVLHTETARRTAIDAPTPRSDIASQSAMMPIPVAAPAVDPIRQPANDSPSIRDARADTASEPAGDKLIGSPSGALDTALAAPSARGARTVTASAGSSEIELAPLKTTLLEPAPPPSTASSEKPPDNVAASAETEPDSESGVLHDLQWLQRQAPTQYTIQLMGSRNADAIRGFATRHDLRVHGAWFTTTLDERPWHVLVYGVYPSRAAALRASRELPPALRLGEPFPRNIGDILSRAMTP